MLLARTAGAGVTLILVSVVVFTVIELIPGDAATRYLGRDATPEAVAALRVRMNLDEPAPVRYLLWAKNALSGDFGDSLTSGRPVVEVLAPKIRNTAILAVVAFLVYVPVSVVPAVIAATNRDRPLDHVISALNLMAVSIPPFLAATFLLIIFVLITNRLESIV